MNSYGYDRDSGEYTGPVKAWESPLEPGVYLLPANATFEQPPAPLEGSFRKWNGSAWVYELIPVAPTPPPPTIEELAASARAQRNGLLLECDWTQLPDVPAGTAALWVSYRQALRNVPQQGGFPTTITWPTKPTQ